MAAASDLPVFRELLGPTPPGGTPPDRGKELYDWVRKHRPIDCLELGFAHGASTLYIAGALESIGVGRLTSVDREMVSSGRRSRRISSPKPAWTIESSPCTRRRVTTGSCRVGSVNGLADGICEPCYDFAFVDGAHTWETDGLAFFLVDTLLRPGGWILFDDLDWKQDERWPDVPPEERAVAQIREIFDLLVATHPRMRELRTDGTWGWARKAETGELPVRTVRRRDVYGALGDFMKMVRARRNPAGRLGSTESVPIRAIALAPG